MNRIFKGLLAVLFISCSFFTLNAQDDADDTHTVGITIPEVAILDIESATSTTISLAPTEPTEAGLALDFSGATDNSLWLNYSSIVGSTSDASRTVTVKIQSGAVPTGLLLKVTAAGDNGSGDGAMGTSAAQLTLTGVAQSIITAIGSCYTGSPQLKGHQLTYVLELNAAAGSYASIDFDESNNVVLVYTISDN